MVDEILTKRELGYIETKTSKVDLDIFQFSFQSMGDGKTGLKSEKYGMRMAMSMKFFASTLKMMNKEAKNK